MWKKSVIKFERRVCSVVWQIIRQLTTPPETHSAHIGMDPSALDNLDLIKSFIYNIITLNQPMPSIIHQPSKYKNHSNRYGPSHLNVLLHLYVNIYCKILSTPNKVNHLLQLRTRKLNIYYIMYTCIVVLTVSLMAFSGATPTSWGAKPLYSPPNPSNLITFLKQSQLFLYMISPTIVVLWFCILVLTRSIGYTAVAPVAKLDINNWYINVIITFLFNNKA